MINLSALRRFLDRFRDCGDLLITHMFHGKFVVRYPDGQWSQPFDYRTAKQYARMNGGLVWHIDDPRKPQ